uniref:Glycosyltransferase 8 domain containing 2 n=1 Tax=Sinocyclocheilus grahami TaxID=75366 RepID=A0A672RTZ7_SINGR
IHFSLSLSLCQSIVSSSILLILVAFALLYEKTRLQTLAKYSVLKKDGAKTGVEDKKTMDTDIPVVICASEEHIGAAMATINSIYSNSRASIFFYIVTLRDAIKKISSLLYNIIFCSLLKELYNIKLKAGHAAAFASDCDLPPTLEMVRSVGMQTTHIELGINPSDCSFNPVFVADLGECKKQKITKQLEKWMAKNVTENLYSSAAMPPMRIVFHDKYTTINPLWHVRHLAFSVKLRQSLNAVLVHWLSQVDDLISFLKKLFHEWRRLSLKPEILHVNKGNRVSQ